MRKIIRLLLMLILLLTVTNLFGCAKPKTELVIGVLPDVDSIPVIIAQHKGWFEEEGVVVKVERFTSAMERDSALQSGAVDGAVSDILAAAFFEEGGFKVRITSMTNGSYKLLASKGMEDTETLEGKSIAISSNTIIEYATDRMLEQKGISPKDVIKTAVPKIPVRLEMLRNNQVDAATLPEPLASSAVKEGAKIIDSTDNLGINPGVMVFSANSIKTKDTAIEAFYSAYNKAVEYLQTAKATDYTDILISSAGFPEDIEDAVTLPEYNAAALPSVQDFDSVIDWLLEKGMIEDNYEYDDLVYRDFIERD